MSLRADELLAAGLAGTEEGLREVAGFTTSASSKLATPTKALGDTSIDSVYTPVTPCRLVETRGTFAAVYRGNGTASHTPAPFASNEVRTYKVQGGNAVCLAQLPAGLNPSAVQLQVFGIPTTSASGDIEILPQGATFGGTATMVYDASLKFNTVSTAAKVNTANKEISVQVRGGGAHLAIDVVGYFAAPSGNGGKFFRQGGNAFGTTATLGTTDNQPLTVLVGNQPALRLAASDAQTVNVINGSSLNVIDAGVVGATIAGGGGTFKGSPFPNHVTGDRGAVGGGYGNTAGALGFVGGGDDNAANGDWSVVGGGLFNVTGGQFSTVGGGSANSATGPYSLAGGGQGNIADGFASVVAGGSNNTAHGTLSLAAGHRAKATTDGSFIWADSREYDFQPSVPNFFGVRATGGVGFTVAIDPTTGGVTQFCNLLPGTPSWQCTSDRNAKENFAPVDGKDVLARVVTMPISTWNFKGGDPALRALGPMAQDFYAAFNLGRRQGHRDEQSRGCRAGGHPGIAPGGSGEGCANRGARKKRRSVAASNGTTSYGALIARRAFAFTRGAAQSLRERSRSHGRHDPTRSTSTRKLPLK
jgi:hypothetical protein